MIKEYLNDYTFVTNKSCMIFFLIRVLMAIMNGAIYIICSWNLFSITNQLSSIATLMLMFWFPTIIIGIIAGIVCDKYQAKYVLFSIHIIKFFVFLACIHTSFLTHTYGLYLLALAQGVLSTFQDPASAVLVRNLVENDKLIFANSLLNSLHEFGNVFGMALAGILIELFSYNNNINLLCYICLFIAVLSIFINSNISRNAKFKLQHLHFYQAFIAGITYIFKNKRILKLYTIEVLILTQFMTVPILLVPYAKNILFASSAEYSQIEALLSLGLVIGGLFLPSAIKLIGMNKVARTAMIISTFLYIALAFNNSLLFAKTAYFLLGLMFMVWSLIRTQAQQATEVSFQGRISSSFNMVSALFLCAFYIYLIVISNSLSFQALYLGESFIALIILLLIVRSKI
jgi:MFS transporter, DHA3 family, macrolide efflux protein